MRALAFVLLLAACTPDFAASSDVTDLRVLATQAEPPEVVFDRDAGSTPPVAVRVLAVDPSRDAGPQEMQLQICGQTDSRRCDKGPVTDVGAVPLAFTLPGIDAGGLGDLLANDDLAGYGGIRLQLSFSVGYDGGPSVYGDKVIVYSPSDAPWVAAPACPPNHNPRIEPGVQLSIDGGPAGVLSPGGSLTIGTEYGFRPQVPPEDRESYCTLDLRGNLTSLREQPRWFFFTGPGGSFDRDTADEPLDGGAPPDGLTRFTPSADGGTLWIVVRDGRGGESWLTLPWTAAADGGR